MSEFHGRNAPIFAKLNSTGERLRVLPAIEYYGSRYLLAMFPTPSGTVLQRVLREKLTFDRGEATRFSNWEIAHMKNHERLVRWATNIEARHAGKHRKEKADIKTLEHAA